MPRNISFAMTTDQFCDGSKDVTRRFAWWKLKPGDVLMAVEKGMGLKKGEKINRLGLIRIVSVRREPLNMITQSDVIREGFPDWTPTQFVQMLMTANKCDPWKICNRIEFERID